MKYMLFQKDCQVLRKLLIEAAPFSWTSMGALPLPGSEARLQGFQVHSSHHIDNAQKQTGLGGLSAQSHREESEEEGWSQAPSWIRLCRESGSDGCWRLNEKGTQLCFHFVRYKHVPWWPN